MAGVSDKADDFNSRILHLNIRSLRKNFDNFLLELPEIIVLTEIWIFDDETVMYNIDNFNSFLGLVVYINKHIKSTKRHQQFISCNGICINVQMNHFYFSLLSIYRSPSNNVESFIAELETALKSHKNNILITQVCKIQLFEKYKNSFCCFLCILTC